MKPTAVVRKTQRPGWFRFGTRTVFILTLFLALLFAWVGRDFVRLRVQNPIVERLEAAGGRVYYDFQVEDGSTLPSTMSTSSRFRRSLFGDQYQREVKAVIWGGRDTPKDATHELGRLSGLKAVSLKGRNVTDYCVEDLLQISNLESLALSNTALSPTAFGKLHACPKLRDVSIAEVEADEHLFTLPHFPKLHSLNLSRCSISNAGIESLGSVSTLRQLRVVECHGFSGEGLLGLVPLKHLELLEIENGNASDETMVAISKLGSLKVLKVSGSRVTDRGVEHLKSLGGIMDLDLSGASIGDGAAKIISGFSQLQNLSLAETRLSDDGIEHLCELSDLCQLDITRTRVTDRGLAKLDSLKSLVALEVEIDSHMTDAGIDEFRKMLPSCFVRSWKITSGGRRLLYEAK